MDDTPEESLTLYSEFQQPGQEVEENTVADEVSHFLCRKWQPTVITSIKHDVNKSKFQKGSYMVPNDEESSVELNDDEFEVSSSVNRKTLL